MPDVRRLYLDTNIFIALGEGGGDLGRLLIELIAQQMPNEPLFLCTSELALAELLVRPYRTGDAGLIQLYDNWIVQGSSWLDVGPVTRDVLWSAALIRQDQTAIKLPDAIHIATAIGFECSHLLTADTGIPKTIRIEHERWGWKRVSAPLHTLRPDEDTLRSIISGRAQA